MRRRLVLAILSILLVAGPAMPAAAGMLRGPTAQQSQCLAAGGSFSAGYDADTYVCVGAGSIQTCRFGPDPATCDTEQGPGRRRTGEQNAPSGPQRPRTAAGVF